MTEQEWLTSGDVAGLDRLLTYMETRSTTRKWRLFACACVRRLWHQVPEQERELVELSEACADGLVSSERVNRALLPLTTALIRPAEQLIYSPSPALFAGLMSAESVQPGDLRSLPLAIGRFLANVTEQIELLRDVFGNPFRPVVVDPGWLAWQAGLIGSLARQIYDERRFDQIPVLGDALEDAGCTDGPLLAHCRGGGLHARGCWVVDAVLGLQ